MTRRELHVVSNGKQEWTELASVAVKIHSYVTAIHFREKLRPTQEIREGLQRLLEAGIPAKRIYINGYPAIAMEAALGGLHMPGSSSPLSEIRKECSLTSELRVGVSVHSVQEAQLRAREGADYLMFGHIFATNSKQGVPPRGLQQLKEVTAAVNIPVIAIGGITPERVQFVLEAGASGVAVMSGVWEAKDPLQTIKTYKDELERMEMKSL